MPEALIEATAQRIGLKATTVGDRVRIERTRGEQTDTAHRIVVHQQTEG